MEIIQISGIVTPKISHYDINPTKEWALQQKIPLLEIDAADLVEGNKLITWMNNLMCSAALVMTFPFKIPQRILDIPELGFFNFHFSLLPSYKGSDPLFWQLKNGEKQTGLTVYKMTKDLDQGPIISAIPLVLMPGEIYGLAYARLTLLITQTAKKIVEQIKSGQFLPNRDLYNDSFFARPQQKDLMINWNIQSAEEIENLVNACNPLYRGAISFLNGEPIRILEVSPVSGEFNPGDTPPGAVFHIDPNYGPMVLTSDKKLLLLNIIEIKQGVFTGKKLCALGMKPGTRLE